MSMTELGRPLSVAEARRALARAFADASLDAPELDARLLISHALGLDHAGIVTAADRILDYSERQRVDAAATRRLGREPVARILGVKEFWSLPFRVTPAVLVPRPETETVIETALELIDTGGPRGRALRLADIGTGSGALLLALLHELPGAHGVGTDRSIDALEVAAENAVRLRLASRAGFVICDFGTALAGAFDLVVSNPPYVASHDIAGLAPEVRDHDPTLALDGGPDGLAAYRMIAADAARLLASGGHLLVEVGAGLAAAAAGLFSGTDLVVVSMPTDLAGIPRVLHVLRAADGSPPSGPRAQKTLGLLTETR